MKKWIAILFIPAILTGCADEQERSADNENVQLEDPANVHPPEEAVPEMMEIENDSTIVPE